MKVFAIDGYFYDDKSEFSGYLVAEYDETPKGYDDDEIFFYGLSEENIEQAIEDEKNGIEGVDFAITGYRIVE
ncbi:MAG: hypothetical protein OQK82_03700 [Candidatus Pacearchaeota archaeon]|nr:hypothetical protein [Candidatus Pacearchaeota archaeon]